MWKAPEMLSKKRVRFVILARKGTSIVARVHRQKQTRHVYILRSNCECAGRNRRDMCIFFVLNVENTRNAFYETRAANNSCSIMNIDRSYSALAETDKTCVYPSF